MQARGVLSFIPSQASPWVWTFRATDLRGFDGNLSGLSVEVVHFNADVEEFEPRHRVWAPT